jgi:uncharacterized SAM-binding protein YcdF (DUF218 family)
MCFLIMNWFYFLLLSIVLALAGTSCKSTEKNFLEVSSKGPYDVIIVPGVPFDTTWSRTMKGRVLWSYHLYNKGIAKNIIYSGSAVYTPYVEGIIMAEYGKALGIPAQHIFSETNAEHSTENLHYSLRIAREKGFKKIALATDPYQSVMLKSFAKRRKMDVSFIPFIGDTLHHYYRDVDAVINPQPAFVKSFVALPDRESWLKRLMGTMGFNIKEEIRQEEVVLDYGVKTISNRE